MMIENDFVKPFIVHFKKKISEHVSPIRPYQQLKRKFKSIQLIHLHIHIITSC